MHELGLCSSIVDAVEQRAGERPVARVTVRVGRLHHVHPEAFDQSFAVAAMGTVARGRRGRARAPARSPRAATRAARRVEAEEIPTVLLPRAAASTSCSPVATSCMLESIEYAAVGASGTWRRMCLGIPGQVMELLEVHEHLARVDVSGVGRVINIGLLEDEHVEPGDWVLIHVGFAMSKIDEDEARPRSRVCSSSDALPTTTHWRLEDRRRPTNVRRDRPWAMTDRSSARSGAG